jgi:hypothetical protein
LKKALLTSIFVVLMVVMMTALAAVPALVLGFRPLDAFAIGAYAGGTTNAWSKPPTYEQKPSVDYDALGLTVAFTALCARLLIVYAVFERLS